MAEPVDGMLGETRDAPWVIQLGSQVQLLQALTDIALAFEFGAGRRSVLGRDAHQLPNSVDKPITPSTNQPGQLLLQLPLCGGGLVLVHRLRSEMAVSCCQTKSNSMPRPSNVNDIPHPRGERP